MPRRAKHAPPAEKTLHPAFVVEWCIQPIPAQSTEAVLLLDRRVPALHVELPQLPQVAELQAALMQMAAVLQDPEASAKALEQVPPGCDSWEGSSCDCEGSEFVDPSLEPSPGHSVSFFS